MTSVYCCQITGDYTCNNTYDQINVQTKKALTSQPAFHNSKPFWHSGSGFKIPLVIAFSALHSLAFHDTETQIVLTLVLIIALIAMGLALQQVRAIRNSIAEETETAGSIGTQMLSRAHEIYDAQGVKPMQRFFNPAWPLACPRHCFIG